MRCSAVSFWGTGDGNLLDWNENNVNALYFVRLEKKIIFSFKKSNWQKEKGFSLV